MIETNKGGYQMSKYRIVFLFLLCFNLLQAEEWSKTQILYLWGNNFNELAGSDRVINNNMSTITLEHANGWSYGSNFFFIDMSSADFGSTKSYKVYSEWAPAFSLSKILNKNLEFAMIKDILISGEINQGDDFQAKNIGMRLALSLPKFNFFDFNVFMRKDNYNKQTYQTTLAWNSTFTMGSVPFIFEGFVDYYGVDFGTEVISQPRLLIDGKFLGLNDLQAGVEFYYYKSSKSPWRDAIDESVPQITAKWIF